MIDEKYARKFAQDLMQEISYKIGDALATMRVICASLEAQLDETDRALLDHLIEHTTACVLPSSMDPRKEAEP